MRLVDFEERTAGAGGRLYLVGGAVRDALLGQSGSDRDYCITGMNAADFVNWVAEARAVGREFPVFHVLLDGEQCEVALARQERKSGIGHRGFEVDACREIGIEHDLLRRDLTINAMAIDVRTGQLVDPFGGHRDLASGILRAVSPAFAEDPLRVYRTARFAAAFGFSVSPETVDMMTELRRELGELVPERVFGELRKAMRTEHPSRFFEVLQDAHVLGVHFPEWVWLAEMETESNESPSWQRDRRFDLTMTVLDRVALRTEDEAVRFAALVTDFPLLAAGHGASTSSSTGPVSRTPAVDVLLELGRRLRLPNRWIRFARTAVTQYHPFVEFFTLDILQQVRCLEALSRSELGWRGLGLIVRERCSVDGSLGCDGALVDEVIHIGGRMVDEVKAETLDFPHDADFGRRLSAARADWLRQCLQ